MDLDELLSLLDASTMRVVKNDEKLHWFNGTAVLSGKKTSALEDLDVAFFSPASYFNMLPEKLRERRAFILYLDEPLKPVSDSIFVATIADRDVWISTFETAAHEFRVLQKKKGLVLSMAELVNHGTGAEALLNVAFSAAGAPCCLLDNSLTYIAVSSNFPEFVTKGEDTKDNTIPVEAFQVLKSKGLTNIRKPFDLHVFDWTDDTGNVYTNHYVPIFADGTIIGSMSFFTVNRRLSPSRTTMLPTIGQIMSLYLQRTDSAALNKSLHYARLFKLLESGMKFQEIDRLERQLAVFGYHLYPYMHIVCVDFSRHLLTYDSIQPLADRLRGRIKNAIYTINQTEILYLSSVEAPGEPYLDEAELERDLTSTAITVGMSSGFYEVEHAKYRIEEARRAITVARRLDDHRHVHPYTRYRIDDLLIHVDDPHVLYGAQFSPLLRLIEEDEREGSELTLTLWHYLQDPTHPADVAEKLFIHKNTLYYRLDKIRSILGNDFKDAETIANLQITFHIMRLQNRFIPDAAASLEL